MSGGAVLTALALAVAPASESWGALPVELDSCVAERGVEREALAYQVSNELQGPAGEAARALGERGSALLVGCTADGVTVTLTGDAPMHAVVSTAGLQPSVATRTVALTIVELLAEPEPAPPAATPQVPTEPEPAPPPASAPSALPTPRPDRARWIVRGGAEALGFVAAPLGLFGGSVDVRHRPRRWGWLAAIAGGGGRDRTPLGRVVAWHASATAAVTLQRPVMRRVDPFGALGIRGGVASLRGHTDAADVVASRLRGGWLGPMLRGGVDIDAGARVRVGLQLELGWAVLGTRARVGGRAGAGASGPWVGGGLAVGTALGRR